MKNLQSSHLTPPPRTAQIDFSRALAGFFFLLFLLAFLTSSTITQAAKYTWDGDSFPDFSGDTLAEDTTFFVCEQYTDDSAAKLSNAISGSSSFTKMGTGTLTLSVANPDYTGDVTVSEGTLKLTAKGDSNDSYGTLNTASDITVSNGATLLLAETHALGAKNSGTEDYGTLTLNGGILDWGGGTEDADYAGIVQKIDMQNGGKIKGNGRAEGTYTITSSITASGTGNEISANALFRPEYAGDKEAGTINVQKNGELTISSSISSYNSSSTLKIVKQGEGTLIFSDNDTNDSEKNLQTLTVEGGTLSVAGGTVTVADATKITSGSVTDADGNETATTGTLSISGGEVTLNGLATVENDGTFTVSGGKVTLKAAGDYKIGTENGAGKFEVTGGEVTIGPASSNSDKANSVILVRNSGEFTVSDGKVTLGPRGEIRIGHSTLSNGTGSFRVEGGTVDLTSGTIKNNGMFEVAGGMVMLAGMEKLSDDATDDATAGGLSLTGGTLNLSGKAEVRNLTFGTAESIALDDEAIISESVWQVVIESTEKHGQFVASSATFNPNTEIEIVLDEDYNLNVADEFDIVVANSFALNDTEVGAVSDLASYNWDSLLSDSYVWNLNYVGLDGGGYALRLSVDANAIPEPATWTLLILGATALVFMRRKR